jgi:hypothetical protein
MGIPDSTEFTVEPFVVISHSLFAGSLIKDVPVVDREILELYFKIGKLARDRGDWIVRASDSPDHILT